jgi:hypothetical protein
MKYKTKKAQMKIQQMSFMLLAVFLFLAMVGMIVVTISMSKLKHSATDLAEQNAKLLATKIANSPEFSCGEVYGGNLKTDCIDMDKVMALKENIGKYITNMGKDANFWGVSNIEIRRLYPPYLVNNQLREVECTTTNYPKCNLVKIINKPVAGYARANYVALCRKEKYNGEIVNKCEMGQISISYEEVK